MVSLVQALWSLWCRLYGLCGPGSMVSVVQALWSLWSRLYGLCGPGSMVSVVQALWSLWSRLYGLCGPGSMGSVVQALWALWSRLYGLCGPGSMDYRRLTGDWDQGAVVAGGPRYPESGPGTSRDGLCGPGSMGRCGTLRPGGIWWGWSPTIIINVYDGISVTMSYGMYDDWNIFN